MVTTSFMKILNFFEYFVNRFRGFLVPRPDWIKGLYLFGTLGLHRLLMKTLKFHKISKFSKNFKTGTGLPCFRFGSGTVPALLF
jgi:hypothetical protein